ncbi:Avidin-related protein 4/5 [Labeo rohita]|uniref:Avidin-related protein 4/5 n=1 Tax=Labeo rohita TaxID=84645 RepID=A0ABQ8L168_LABRO|nr:avidin-related protein 4/5 [Labeo rohita]KAI2644145.1 Avidin-related protein 4/5 [Labeo rohita]
MDQVRDVSGKWKNDLGSVMELKEDGTGKISGTYTTAAEFFMSNEPGEAADLVGYIKNHTDKEIGIPTTTITFCMAWKIEGSCSAFTGQIFPGENNEQPVIKTTWLLHSPVDGLQHNWASTRVGENTFYKIQTHQEDSQG